MALLLKVTAGSLDGTTAIVPRMKSAALVPADVGAVVYVWLDDDRTRKGSLNAVTTLTSFEEIMVPQAHDPSKSKHAYRLTLAEAQDRPVQDLTTADLGPSHHVEGADGIESLGRIHRDRNDRIMRLTNAEAAVLAERFRH